MKIRRFIFIFIFTLSACDDLKKFEDGFNSNMSTDEVFSEHPDVRPLWEGQHPESAKWTSHVLKKLDDTPMKFLVTVPTDINTFCPKYAKLNKTERKYFWAYLISIMVRFESDFDPSAKYEEDMLDQDGSPVISRGLLQISFESSLSYGCGFNDPEQIHDPLRNLACGVKILSKWVVADKSIAGYADNNWRGGARYWSVLRAADKESYNTIVERSHQLSLCN